MMRILLFIGVVLPVVFFAHRYVWRRLVRDPELTGWRRHLGTAVIVGGCTALVGGFVLMRFTSRDLAGPLYVTAFSWMGLMALMLVLLVPWELAKIPGALARWRQRINRVVADPELESTIAQQAAGEAAEDAAVGASHQAATPDGAPPEPAPTELDKPTNPDRRRFVRRLTAGTTIAGSAGLFVIGSTNALGEIEVKEVPVALPRLPKALDGLRIVQLTDVHIGPILDARFLESVVEKVNAQKPDLVVITGDLVDGPTRILGPDVSRLGGIQSRWGTWFCTGNHEYYSGVDDWVPFLSRLGIGVLHNQRVTIGDKGASIDLAGIPDVRAGRFHPTHEPDLAKALAGRDPERELVLLAHRPNPIHEAAKLGVGLQISGHTHGGQFFPITLGASLVHPYNAGLHRHGAGTEDTQIYVSRGTGFWGPPIRILAPAEITSLVLTTA